VITKEPKGEKSLNLGRSIMYGALLVAGCFAAYSSWRINMLEKKQVALVAATAAKSNAVPRCTFAAGYIWDDVKLYRNSTCQEPFAKIVLSSREEVFIQLDSGEVETKTFDALKNQAYVMTNDPAIP
jgi:hypothetical protein